MAKPKRGPALFDLLAASESEPAELLKVPGWWTGDAAKRRSVGHEADAGEPLGGQGPVPAVAGSDDVAAEDSGADPAASDMATRRPRGRIPFIELDGAWFRVSFTSLTAALGALALMVVFVGMFEWGRRSEERPAFRRGYAAGRASYEADTMKEIAEARRRAPATELIGSLLVDTAGSEEVDRGAPAGADAAGAASDPAETATRWIRGATYIVVQVFMGGRGGDALAAQSYLAERGIRTEVVTFPSGVTHLVTAQGFNHGDPGQKRMAQRLMEEIRAAGARYYASGGGYKLEGYFKTLKGDHW